ncbi:hypothetical protein DOTSEDRAFT_75980 [Dothistroma septosporum NZE10]|uniref:Uncharacterized protein n=1 Tax=Dothistroma septosporum (strain NZE10 / CBS 128990) TaxID=675120 RepID=M2YI29_DOTSN|nr:hypothetical protein DOTSEDRAFT_75980 [Dothistroma septosporum NZE10]
MPQIQLKHDWRLVAASMVPVWVSWQDQLERVLYLVLQVQAPPMPPALRAYAN